MARPNKAANAAFDKNKPLSPELKKRLDEEKLFAMGQISAAMRMTGLMDREGHMACPSGKPSHNQKVKIFMDNYTTTLGDSEEEVTAQVGKLHCYGCGQQWSAIDLVMEMNDKAFRDAVLLLNGKADRGGEKIEIDLDSLPEIKGEPKVELTDEMFNLYHRFWELCDADAAKEFYSEYGIKGEVIDELGFRYLTEPNKVAAAMFKEFGQETLLQSGLVVLGKNNKPRWLANSEYPVIETYIYPDGKVSGFQFRASKETSKLVKAHTAYQDEVRAIKRLLLKDRGIHYYEQKDRLSAREFREWDEALTKEAKQLLGKPEVEHKSKFLSIKGAGIASRIGFGLPHLSQLPSGELVWEVEGGKNTAAGRSEGRNFVGFPGSKFPPVRAVCNLLARHNLRNAYDPDEGGDDGRKKHIIHMAKFGVEYESASYTAWYDYDEEERTVVFDTVEVDPTNKYAMTVKKWREDNGLTATHYRNKDGMDIAEMLEERIKAQRAQ